MSDINDLMDLDPFKCTREDISKLIETIRQGRATFNLNAKDPTSKAARKGPTAAPVPKLKIDLMSILKKKD